MGLVQLFKCILYVTGKEKSYQRQLSRCTQCNVQISLIQCLRCILYVTGKKKPCRCQFSRYTRCNIQMSLIRCLRCILYVTYYRAEPSRASHMPAQLGSNRTAPSLKSKNRTESNFESSHPSARYYRTEPTLGSVRSSKFGLEFGPARFGAQSG